jgi:lipoprotein-anchoring transpeptidase ErfK/SrfK
MKSSGGRTKKLSVAIGVVAAVAIVAAVTILAVRRSGTSVSSSSPEPPTHGVVADAPAPVKPVAPSPVTGTSINPGSGQTDVPTNAVLTVNYSLPLTGTPPAPTLSPAVAGTWNQSGSVMTFVPSGGWVPFTTETVTVPPGASATLHGTTTASIATTTTTFTVEAGDQTRLEQLLAELNYLPFTFTPSVLPAGVTTGLTDEPTTASAVSTSALAGTMAWAYPNIPASLSALWTPGQASVIDKGAIMAFESVHDMTVDGLAGPAVWSALVGAVAARQVDPNPYDYLTGTETLPETLTVWRAGQVIYTTPSNTGVPGATTETGTFPVYARYTSTTMTGTNVDGSKYVDPGIPWVAYFNGGDAVHGYVRASYGFPQSNGCIELPVANAAQVFTMDPLGTLVTVSA